MMQLTPRVRAYLGIDDPEVSEPQPGYLAPPAAPEYDPRDADSGPWEAPATSSYNDPTASGTISQPLPQYPASVPPVSREYPADVPGYPEPTSYTIQDGRTAPPTPSGQWEAVRTIPNPQKPPAADPATFLADDSQSTPPPPMADYPTQPPGSPYGDQQAAMEPAPNRFAPERVSTGQVTSTAGEPDYVPSRAPTYTGRAVEAVQRGVQRSAQEMDDPGLTGDAGTWLANQLRPLVGKGPLTGDEREFLEAPRGLPEPVRRALTTASQVGFEIVSGSAAANIAEELWSEFGLPNIHIGEFEVNPGSFLVPNKWAMGGMQANTNRMAQTATQRAIGQAAVNYNTGVAGAIENAPGRAITAARNAAGPLVQGVRGMVDDALEAGSRALSNAGEAAARNVPAGESMLGSGFIPINGFDPIADMRGRVRPDAGDIEQRAVQQFGATENVGSMGYVLRDGTGLDFSGGNGGGRGMDHRSVTSVLEGGATGTPGMRQFMGDTGAVRVSMNSGRELSIDIPNGLAPKQRQLLMEEARYAERVYLDITDPKTGENLGSRSFTMPNERGALNQAIRAIPEHVIDEPTAAVAEQAAKSESLELIRSRMAFAQDLLAGKMGPIDETARAYYTRSLAEDRTKLRALGGGSRPQGSGLIPTMSDARNAAQGGVIGAASEMTSDEELTPQERLARIGVVGTLGVAAGRATRGRGTRVPGQRKAGSGFVPIDGYDPIAEMRGRVVPPNVADTLDFPVRVPTDPGVIRAIEAADGHIDPERGVTLGVTRAQSPAGHGAVATRGGVFYEAIPQGGQSSYFRPGKANPQTGGSDVLPRRATRFRSPLIVNHPPGSNEGFDQAMAQMGRSHEEALASARTQANEAWEAVRRAESASGPFSQETQAAQAALRAANDDVERLVQPSVTARQINDDIFQARRAGSPGSPERTAALKSVVRKYGGDDNLVDDMVAVRGSDVEESEWAVRENILAAHTRRNGYDGVITVEPQDGNFPSQMAMMEAVDNHPLVKAGIEKVGAAAEAYRLNSGPETRRAMREAQAELNAARDAAREELRPYSITELVDVREARNPTPGEPNPLIQQARAAFDEAYAAEKAAEKASGDAVQAWRRANPGKYGSKEMYTAPEIEATNQALAEAQQRADALRTAYLNTRDANPAHIGTPGYTLRDDIPRRADAAPAPDPRFETPKASGMLPFDPASAAAGAGAGAEVDEDGNPVGVDPLRAAAGMAFAGMAGTPQGRRLVLRSAKAAKNTAPPNLLEVMQNFRFSWGMLGNFSTGAVNAMGAPVEIALGLPSEAFRMGILRHRPAAAVYQAVELVSGLRQGVRDMLGTIIGQVPAAIRNAPDFRPPMSERMTGTAGKAVGHAIEAPGRITSQAPDALWRPMLERWGRAREAGNIMAESGVSRFRPDEQVKEMHRLLNNPTPEEAARLDEAAKAWADEMGYKGDAGYFEQAIGSLVRPNNRTATANDPVAAQVHEALGSFVMPFFGTVWKLHKLAASRAPVVGGLANRSLKWDENLSRQAVGAGLGLYIADRAAQGLVTGPGPSDPDEAALVNKDMPPNSTYVPAVGWVPNDYFGSAGPYLNAIGGYYDARRYATDKEKADADKMGERTAKDVLRAFQRFPVAQAVQNVVAMVESPTKGVTDFLANAGSSFVPAPAKTYMASQDPLSRTTDRESGFVDQLTQKTKARTGIMRQELPAAQDRLGRDVENPRQGAAAFGLNIKQPQNDPVVRLLRETGVEPGAPKKEITRPVPRGASPLPPVALTPKDQRDWNRARGQKFLELVTPKLSDPEFQAKTPALKKAQLEFTLKFAGEYADGVVLRQKRAS